MATSKSKSLYPTPIYEARMSNGEIMRLSFRSPAGKPIDFAHGRKVIEEIYFTDTGNAVGVRWERGSDGAWRGRWPMRNVGVSIVAGFVEHQTIGRVEDTEEARNVRAPVKLLPRYNRQALIERARAALQAGRPSEALAILQLAA